MKKITLLLALMISSLGFSQTTLREYSFPDAGSVTISQIRSTTPDELINVVPIADGSSPDASFSYSSAGNPTGALQISGVNTEERGRNFLYRINDDKIDYKGASKLNVSFDIRIVGVLLGSAVNLQVQIPQKGGGVIPINQFDLQNREGFGETYLNISFDIDNPQFDNATKLLIMDFGIAAGAFIGSGGTILIDNLVIKGTTVVTTCTDGIQNGDETGIDCGGSCAPCAAPLTPPTTAAPTPTKPAADVKSLFSNAYTPITTFAYSGDDNSYNTNWSDKANTALIQVDGNDTNVITGLGTGITTPTPDLTSSFEGIAFQAGRFDATAYTHLHMDIWTPTPTLDRSFNLKFSNWDNRPTGPEANAIEYSVTNASIYPLPNPNPGTWISLDIPFSDWTAGSRNDLVQFIITSNLGTVYYDNLYIWGTDLSTQKFETTSSVRMYPNPVKNTLTIEANSEIQRVSVYTILGQEVLKSSPKSNTATLQTNELQKGVYMVTTEIDGKLSTSKMVKE